MSELSKIKLKQIARKAVFKESILSRLSFKINSLWHELLNFSFISRMRGQKAKSKKVEKLEEHIEDLMDGKESIKDFLHFAGNDQAFLSGRVGKMVREIGKIVEEQDLENAEYSEEHKVLHMPYHSAPRAR